MCWGDGAHLVLDLIELKLNELVVLVPSTVKVSEHLERLGLTINVNPHERAHTTRASVPILIQLTEVDS